MNDAALVRVIQSRAALDDEPELLHHGQLALGGDHLVQRLAFQVLHDQVRIALLIAQVIHDDDVRVLQHPGGLCFTVETLEQIRVLGKPAGHHLDCDQTADAAVRCLVDDAHAAFA